ncbi:MAG: T9SS type A sorting domain-containing protein, partial [Bacteroidota bacterium]
GLAEVDSKNTPAAFDAWLRNAKNGNKVDDANYATGAILVDPKNATAPDFRPVVASKINTLANYDAAVLTKFGKFSAVNTVGNVVVTNAYPVPAVNNVNVELYALASNNVTVSISDISGKVVKSLGNQSLITGGNLITADVTDLNNGLYFLNVVSNGLKSTFRFTVAH